jgi:hypothetical protein
MTKVDITAVLNFHREGYLAPSTFASAARAERHAVAAGRTVEVVLVLDRPDELTRALSIAQKQPHWRLFEVDYGDLGLSRNFGVSEANGALVAFLDGDDLWGENWLTRCFAAYERARGLFVWHTEVNIYFGAHPRVFRHIDMENEEFDLLDLAFNNLWTALICAPINALREIPYAKTDLSNRLGYEDWSWNLQSIERGYIHKIVPGTGHAIRTKHDGTSLLQRTNSTRAAPHPSYVFRSLLRRRRPYDFESPN